MNAQVFKKLIKDSVREVLREELANLGKQKIQESLGGGEEWPTLKFNTGNTNPELRQSLVEKMGIPMPETPKNAYADILAEVASKMKPGEAANFRNMGE